MTTEKKLCNRETEVYSRVVGFYRPTKLWNKGKKEEFKKREEFQINHLPLIPGESFEGVGA